jgi:hypothetical protein
MDTVQALAADREDSNGIGPPKFPDSNAAVEVKPPAAAVRPGQVAIADPVGTTPPGNAASDPVAAVSVSAGAPLRQ